MARANSLILPRSTLTRYGGYSLPLTDVLICICITTSLSVGASGFALRHGPAEEFLEIGDDEALVAPLRDLLDLVEDVDLEQAALSVRLEERGLGAHLHAERSGGEMLHLHHGANADGAGREVRLHRRVAGELHEVDHER